MAEVLHRELGAQLTAAVASRDAAEAVAVLQTMAGLESNMRRVRCMQGGAGEAVMDALATFYGDEEVVRAGCRALRNLANFDATSNMLVRDGAHVAVMAAARAHASNVEVARGACTTLAAMVVGASDALKPEGKGIRDFLQFMLDTHPGGDTVQECRSRVDAEWS